MEPLQASPQTVDQLITRRIRNLLKNRKVTYREFASKCGLPYRTVQNYLSDNARIPADFVAKTCDIFGVESDFIIFGGVDIGRTAFDKAVSACLSEMLPDLEISGSKLVAKTPAYTSYERSSAKMAALHNVMAMMMAAKIRDEYNAIRLDQLRTEGQGGVSPGDAARQAFEMEAFGLIRGAGKHAR